MKKIIGALLAIVALAILGSIYFPIVYNEINYRALQTQSTTVEAISPLYPDFGIVIPKLGINARIIKDVDPYNSQIYQRALAQGVAHAKGTALPDEPGNIFIFSHSSENFLLATKYNSIFYLLTKLETGDEVTLYYQNQKYSYHVTQKVIVDPRNLSYLQNNHEEKTLTLMTCYPPGTDLKRLIVVAK